VRAYLVGAVLVLPLAGCGGGASYRTAPVSGRVTLDGKPLPDATVEFVPEAKPEAKGPLPSSIGLTDADGRYSLALSSGSQAKGAVVGKHKVIILLSAAAGAHDTKPTFHKQLPARYNRQTELTRDVPAEGLETNFELKSK
jgi:hypothetical protein